MADGTGGSEILSPLAEDSFNTIFQRLTVEPDDLVGLIAYGLYKQAKRDWVLRYKNKHRSYPEQSDMQAYHDHFSDDDLLRFRSQAESMMLDFAEVIVEDRRLMIEDNARNGELKDIKTAIISKIADSTKFWDQVKASVIAWVISLALTVLIITVFNFTLIADALKKIVGAGS